MAFTAINNLTPNSLCKLLVRRSLEKSALPKIFDNCKVLELNTIYASLSSPLMRMLHPENSVNTGLGQLHLDDCSALDGRMNFDCCGSLFDELDILNR